MANIINIQKIIKKICKLEDTKTIQARGYWNYTSWRILELYKLEDTGTIAGGYWNYSWRILELYKLEDTGTIQAGGYQCKSQNKLSKSPSKFVQLANSSFNKFNSTIRFELQDSNSNIYHFIFLSKDSMEFLRTSNYHI